MDYHARITALYVKCKWVLPLAYVAEVDNLLEDYLRQAKITAEMKTRLDLALEYLEKI